MKLLRIVCLVAISGALLGNVSGQGFVNLNFEQAVIKTDPSVPFYPYGVYASNAIPGWTAIGFLSPNYILYNDISLGATSVSLLGTNTQYSPGSLDGLYSIDLYGGTSVGAIPPGASISQTGLVPFSALSIRFIAQGVSGGGPLLVSLGGQNIPFSALSAGPNYTLYGGDISAFAGQVEELKFLAPLGVNNYWEIDDIQFSPVAVPEPNTLSLFGVCILCLAFRERRRSPGR